MARKYTEADIVSIRNDRDRVRRSPTLYVPDRGPGGAIHIIFEYVDNAIDENSTEDAVGKTIVLRIDKNTREVTVIDDGSDIPHGSLLDAFTVLSTSGKFDNDAESSPYTYSGGAFGFGSKLGTFLSVRLEVTSMREGKYLTYNFENGLLVYTKTGKSREHGTMVRFLLDNEYVRMDEVDFDEVRERLREKSYCFPDLVLTYALMDGDQVVETVTYTGNTMLDLVKDMKPDTEIIRVEDTRKVSILRRITDSTVTESKVLVDAAGKVRGVHMLGNPCSEIIVAAAIAVEKGLTVPELLDVVWPHPTVGEVLKETLGTV